MCSVHFSRKPNIHEQREKKQNFMTKPSQYPEKYTLPVRHIHHSTIVWLDPVTLFRRGIIFLNLLREHHYTLLPRLNRVSPYAMQCISQLTGPVLLVVMESR